MVVTCNAASYYPLQCHVELEVAWFTTLLLGGLVCVLMRSIWVTTHELKRLQHQAELDTYPSKAVMNTSKTPSTATVLPI
jgi:hypothetical protein